MSQLLRFTVWIVLVTFSLLFAFAQMYGIYRFNAIHNLLIVKKRYPQIIVVEACIAVFQLLIAIPFCSNTLFAGIPMNFISNDTLQYIGWLLLIPSLQIIGNLEAIRLWLMSYNLHYLESSKKQKWKSHIDPSLADQNWYLHNRNTYGSKKYMLPRVLSYYLVSVTVICLSFVYLPRSVANILDTLLFSPVLAMSVYSYYKCPKIPKLNDNFLFYYELKASALIFASAVVCYIAAQIVAILGYKLVCDIITMCTACCAFSLPSLFSTIWITNKISSIGVWNRSLQSNLKMLEIRMNDKSDLEMSKNVPIAEQMNQTFKNEQKFELFVEWIYSEFCAEIILCFIEYCKFKEYLALKCHDTHEQYTYINLFYDDIPKMHVFNARDKSDKIADSCKIAHVLYNKYIEEGSEFEVNINPALREKYQGMDQENWNLDNVEFVHSFDELLYEMHSFIESSYVRFINYEMFNS